MEHKNGIVEGYSKKYRCHALLFYEEFSDVQDAIAREKELKGWSREKKETLIRSLNPYWNNLAVDLEWL